MSFAQEMKDFNSSFQSTTKTFDDSSYKKALTEQAKANTNDDEDNELDKQMKRAQIAALGRRGMARPMTPLQQLQMRNLQMDLDRKRQILNGEKPTDPAAAAIPDNPSAPKAFQPQPDAAPADATTGPRSEAIPTTDVASNDDIGDDVGGDTNFAACGGTVVKAAKGGAIPAAPVADTDNDPDSEGDDDTDDAVAPGNPASQYSTLAAHDAVAGGLQELHDRFGLTQARAGALPSSGGGGIWNAQGYHRGQGAAPLADMEQIYKKIDPNNQMSDSERNMAALSAVWQFKLKQGDPEGAKRAAAMMLQHYRLASQRYAAIAAVAGQNGNADLAAKAAMKAYANIPDGKNLQVTKTPEGQLQIQYTDENGKLIHGGLMTPQQLGAQAMGVASKGFDQFLMQSAGQQPKGKGGAGAGAIPGAPKPMKPGDKEKEQQNLDTATGAQFTDEQNQSMQPELKRAIVGTAKRISARNPQFTDDESVDFAKRLLMPDAKDPDKTPFTSKRVEDDNGNVTYQVRFGKRLPITMGEDEFDDVVDRRAELLASQKKAKDAADKKAKEPGVVDSLKKVYSDDTAGKTRKPMSADERSAVERDVPDLTDRPAPGAKNIEDSNPRLAIPDDPSRSDPNSST